MTDRKTGNKQIITHRRCGPDTGFPHRRFVSAPGPEPLYTVPRRTDQPACAGDGQHDTEKHAQHARLCYRRYRRACYRSYGSSEPEKDHAAPCDAAPADVHRSRCACGKEKKEKIQRLRGRLAHTGGKRQIYYKQSAAADTHPGKHRNGGADDNLKQSPKAPHKHGHSGIYRYRGEYQPQNPRVQAVEQ